MRAWFLDNILIWLPIVGVLQCVAVCCSVRQCVAVCCSVLQCGACLIFRQYTDFDFRLFVTSRIRRSNLRISEQFWYKLLPYEFVNPAIDIRQCVILWEFQHEKLRKRVRNLRKVALNLCKRALSIRRHNFIFTQCVILREIQHVKLRKRAWNLWKKKAPNLSQELYQSDDTTSFLNNSSSFERSNTWNSAKEREIF